MKLETVQTRDTQAEVSALIQLVGVRVREVRKEAGLTRRALSDRSGVSPRYLAQLEGGTGNISIGLLKQISIALDTPIEVLITAATPATNPARICLIGLRGAGKSTLGALLARDMELPFVELNTQIEAKLGIPIGEVIALYGDDGYRQIEAEVLDQIIAENERLVLAVAGGIVASDATFDRVLSQFRTVWIKAQPSEHMDRVRAQGDLRPMAGNPKAMGQLRDILRQRAAHYAKAAYQLDTSGKTVQDSRAELTALLRQSGDVSWM